MDRLAHRPNATPDFVETTFYGRLLEIFAVKLPGPTDDLNLALRTLNLAAPTTFLLARILPCDGVRGDVPNFFAYNTHVHTAASPEVVDLACLSAVVGRIIRDRFTYVIDRSSAEHPTVFGNAQDR